MKIKTLILLLCILGLGKIAAQTTPAVPYLFITQQQFGNLVTVVPPTNTNIGKNNYFSVPSTLDFGAAFNIYVDVAKGSIPSTRVIYLFMQDQNTGTGATNGGSNALPNVTTPQSLRFVLDNTYTSTTIDRYKLTINAGNYPTLMNSGTGWTGMKDGTIIYTGFNIYAADSSNGANVARVVANTVSIAGFKRLLMLKQPATTQPDVIIELNQYDPVTVNLEQMLVNGVTLSNGQAYNLPAPATTTTYSWYFDDPYGANPHAHAVNSQYNWLNNLYQSGIKPWINSSHIDFSNPAYMSTNKAGVSCYTLTYYMIQSSLIPTGTQSVVGGITSTQYVDTATFKANARKVIVRIQPATASHLIPYPITIAKQDYGAAPAGTQWGPQLDASQTTYTYAGNALPQDGQYSIAQDIAGRFSGASYPRPPDWYLFPAYWTGAAGTDPPAKKYDHTYGNGTGYMYLVNATASPGTFYRNSFAVCPNMNLQFSLWLMDMSDGNRLYQNPYPQYRIKPNVRIQIYSGNLPLRRELRCLIFM
ncbi:MAG: hypothetical protein LBR52_03165 [Prevotellaceae bacterium]|jgi:hypothetical protein|nr:hypothetical protein [Prevotellaceae bacterium]